MAKGTAEANAPVANHLNEIADMPTSAMNVLSELYSLASLMGVKLLRSDITLILWSGVKRDASTT